MECNPSLRLTTHDHSDYYYCYSTTEVPVGVFGDEDMFVSLSAR